MPPESADRDERPTVLIAEDEELLLESFQLWLEEDYTVRTALDGEAALETFDDGVDVALLDRRMPGKTGDEVLNEIRSRGYRCKVAMVTAVDPDFDIIEMGFDTYITKPVTKEELIDTVERLLTITQYTADSQELFAVAEKQAALRSELPVSELEANEEYAELEARRTQLAEQAQDSMDTLDHTTATAAFRDLQTENGS